MTITAKQKKKFYEKALEYIGDNLVDNNYVCLVLTSFFDKKIDCFSKKFENLFPEIFLFKDFGEAFLSHANQWEIDEALSEEDEDRVEREINLRKIMVLQFCIEMCKDEIKEEKLKLS